MTLGHADHSSILQTLARVAHAVDRGRAEELRGLYTETAALEVRGLGVEAEHAGAHAGRDAVVDSLVGLYAHTRGHCRHWNGLPDIRATAQGATATSYFVVVRTGQVPQAGVILTGIYLDDLVRVDGEWLIQRRVCSIDPQPEDGADSDDPLVLARDKQVAGQ
jgi:hypothetical protein